MADDVAITPGAGAAIATDEIAGRHHQIIKPAFGADGVATLVSPDDPLPVSVQTEILETLRALQVAVTQLSRSIGQNLPTPLGQMRVSVDAITATTLSTITTVGTVTTVGSITNAAQVGGYSAADQIASTMRAAAQGVRQQIGVST
jgi:hypothetical protein